MHSLIAYLMAIEAYCYTSPIRFRETGEGEEMKFGPPLW